MSERASRSRLWWAAGATILATVAAVAVWVVPDWNDLPEPSPEEERTAGAERTISLAKPAPPPGGYVGSAACAECHAEISDTYASHPMSRSLAGVREASPIENYGEETKFSPGGRRSYYVEKTDEGVRHHEMMAGEDGEVVFDQAVEVDYALGSGQRGRAYLFDRCELLFLSPINWYSEKQRWDLAPGYLPGTHPRFERRAGDACLVCHSGRLAAERGTPDRYHDPPFLEESIGCERCHGPGREHIEYHRLGEETDLVDTIVNPAKLEPARREAVCYQCHLQGEARVLRYGRGERDFRPGDRLEDVWTVFVKGTRIGPGAETTRAISHVGQMRSSGCYEGSEGALGCISCHDPHSKPAPERRATYFNNRCLDCHSEHGCALPERQRRQPPASGSCIVCHMPPLPTNDVPHTSQTDHRILRRPSETEAARKKTEPPLEIFDGAADRMPDAAVDRARGLLMINLAEAEESVVAAFEAEQLLKPVADAAKDDLAVWEALGTASRIQGRDAEAIARWRRVLQADPDRESTLVSLAKAYHETGQLRAGVATLERVFTINSWIGSLYGRQAHMLGQLGAIEPAIGAAKRAIELNPTLAQVYGWLAEVYRRQGDSTESARYESLYRQIDGG